MIGVKSYADKAIDAVARNLSALERARDRLAEHDRGKAAGDDADALFAWRRDRRDLEDRVAAAEEALVFAKTAADKAAADLVEREANAKHVAADKAAAADVKIVHEVDALIRKLADARNRLAASVARTDEANKAREGRPFILDAETRVRGTPSHVRPAVYEERIVWRNAAGGQPRQWRRAPNGEMVPDEAACGHDVFKRRVERVEMRAETFEGATMPVRYADALKLVDLAGRPL